MNKNERADPLLEELDEARRRMWDACDHDLDKYLAMLQERHRQLLGEGWREAPPRGAKGKSAA